jgi:septal ring factor EnvC (AmiA/AmiB activator)
VLGLRLVSMIAAANAGSIHLEPCIAEAEKPARMPRRRERNHAAFARNSAVSSASFGAYTSLCSAVYRVRSSYGVSKPAARASLPRNGSAMAESVLSHTEKASRA